jgi:hypothetical protein
MILSLAYRQSTPRVSSFGGTSGLASQSDRGEPSASLRDLPREGLSQDGF